MPFSLVSVTNSLFTHHLLRVHQLLLLFQSLHGVFESVVKAGNRNDDFLEVSDGKVLSLFGPHFKRSQGDTGGLSLEVKEPILKVG